MRRVIGTGLKHMSVKAFMLRNNTMEQIIGAFLHDLLCYFLWKSSLTATSILFNVSNVIAIYVWMLFYNIVECKGGMITVKKHVR